MIYKQMIKDATEASKKFKPPSKSELASMLCDICPDLDKKDLMKLNKHNLHLLLSLLR